MKTTTRFSGIIPIKMIAFSGLVALASCKKNDPPRDYASFMNGSWSCDFNACEVTVDSSLSIFSHVTDLSISGVDINNNDTDGTFSWEGCIEGSGLFRVLESDRSDFDCLFVPKSDGLTELDPDLNLVPASFDWENLVPDGAVPDVVGLNATKIYVKKTGSTSMIMFLCYPDGSTTTYSWVRS